jgi:hypothetical protein
MGEQKNVREKKLYPKVEEFLKMEEPKGFGADFTGQSFGKVAGRRKNNDDPDIRLKLGKIDVFGVKEYKELFINHFEVIGVEVKLDSYKFAQDLGQTLSYSLFCHRLYYAFEKESRKLKQTLDFAASLGIGIIKINKDSPKDSEILLYSKLFNPDKNFLLDALEYSYPNRNNPKEFVKLEECIVCKKLVKLKKRKGGSIWSNKNAINYIFIGYDGKVIGEDKENKDDKHIQVERGEDEGERKQYFTLCKDCRKNFNLQLDKN